MKLEQTAQKWVSRLTDTKTIPLPLEQLRIKGLHPLWITLEGGRFLLERYRVTQHLDHLEEVPQGHGEPIVVIPAMPWMNFSLNLLRLFLKKIGYGVLSLDFKWNAWSLQSNKTLVLQQVQRLAAQEGPLTLIAHSLGAPLAREIAEQHPEMIRHLIFLGASIPSAEAELIEAIPIGKEASSSHSSVVEDCIWSAHDAFTPPLNESLTQDNEHYIEVKSSHSGMIVNWEVFQAIAECLATSTSQTKKTL